MTKVTKAWLRKLYQPPKRSHKGDNGKLVIIAGSAQFHGAAVLACKTAARIVDLVFFASVPENNRLIQKLKQGLAEVIVLKQWQVDKAVALADAVLIGPGLGYLKTYGLTRVAKRQQRIKRQVERLLRKFPQKKFILDADVLKTIDPKKLTRNCVVTPHTGEFKALFKVAATEANVRKMAQKYSCIILLKGPKDIICSPTQCVYNTTGNQGMTKGGTGDVLAGLVAALAAKNDLFLAAGCGAYINGAAGDRLKKQVGLYYSVADLVEQIPKVLKDWDFDGGKCR